MTRFGYILLLVHSFFLTGCVSLYQGDIYPANVEIDGSDFKIIKTVSGSAQATYVLGIGGGSAGLVKEAKENMYHTITLESGEIITNVTKDERWTCILCPLIAIKKVTLSADIIRMGERSMVSEPMKPKSVDKSIVTFQDQPKNNRNTSEQKIRQAKSCTDCRLIKVNNSEDLKLGDLIMHKDPKFGQKIYGIVVDIIDDRIKLETYPNETRLMQVVKMVNIWKVEN